MKKPRLFVWLLSVSVGLMPLAAVHAQTASSSGAIEVKTVAEVEIATTDAAGKAQRTRAPADKVIPGTEVIYTTTFKNIGAKPAGNIVINNPVPAHTTLVAGSAVGQNADITYSVDGTVFATPDKLTVKNKEGKDVPARAADYSHIRWTHKGELAAGKTGAVGFRVVLN